MGGDYECLSESYQQQSLATCHCCCSCPCSYPQLLACRLGEQAGSEFTVWRHATLAALTFGATLAAPTFLLIVIY